MQPPMCGGDRKKDSQSGDIFTLIRTVEVALVKVCKSFTKPLQNLHTLKADAQTLGISRALIR